MPNYTKTTDFSIKDALATGNSAKVIRGTEHDIEYNNIAVAIATKADSANGNHTGTASFQAINATATITAVSFSGPLTGNASSATTAGSATSAATAADFAAGGWHMYASGGYLYFVYSGVVKARLGPDGTFYAAGDVGAYIGL